MDDLFLSDGVHAVDTEGAASNDIEAAGRFAFMEEVFAGVEIARDDHACDAAQVIEPKSDEEFRGAETLDNRGLFEFGGRGRHGSRADLAGTEANPFIGAQFVESHRSASTEFIGADADFRAHAVFAAVGEAG